MHTMITDLECMQTLLYVVHMLSVACTTFADYQNSEHSLHTACIYHMRVQDVRRRVTAAQTKQAKRRWLLAMHKQVIITYAVSSA
jgi:hypothetical protein